MTRFVISRIGRALLVVLGLIIATFFLTRTFADPARIMLPIDAGPEEYARLRAALGLDRPLFEQLFSYIGQILQGDFGTSIWQKTPALPLALRKVGPTLFLGLSAILLALIIGVPLGIIAARRPGSIWDRCVVVGSSIAISIADFWLGVMLILLFSVNLGWLPTSGYGGFRYLILPLVTLWLRPMGRVANITRTAVVDELEQRYVMTARAKGLSLRQVVRHHVMKNVVPVILTVVGYEFIFIFTGYAVAVEVVFNWPGLGRTAVQAVLHNDVVLVSAVVIVAGVLVSVLNTLLDIAHAAIDRRVSL